jgi:site-specific recombinase XerD
VRQRVVKELASIIGLGKAAYGRTLRHTCVTHLLADG